jgi:hypothetical protein
MITGVCRIVAVIIEMRDKMSIESTEMKVIRVAAAMVVVIKREMILEGVCWGMTEVIISTGTVVKGELVKEMTRKANKETVREKSIWNLEKWYEDKREMTVRIVVW